MPGLESRAPPIHVASVVLIAAEGHLLICLSLACVFGSHPITIFAAKRPLPLCGSSDKDSNESVKNVANIKSQIKRIGTNKKAQDRNKAVKSEFKTAIRAARLAITSGDKDKAVATLAVASKKLDKAVSKGVIHKNQAANKKSAIAKSVAALV